MPDILELLDQRFLGNPLRTWLLAAALALLTWKVWGLLRSRYAKISRRGDRQHGTLELVVRLMGGVMPVFAWTLALYAAARLLQLPEIVERASTIILLAIAWIQVGVSAVILFDYLVEMRRRNGADAALASSIAVIRFAALVAIWSLILLLALANFGVDVTALIAGLGIGGIAAALAVQTILKDLLASLTIALDRPFAVDDVITVGAATGKVEHIGARSTRLRSSSGELIELSNADLASARLRNFGRLDERRGVVIFGLVHETPAVKLRRVSQIVESIIRAQPGVRFERCHFRDIGAHALNFEAVFFAMSTQMDALLAAQQAISLALQEALHREGIDFAYPAQRAQYEYPAAAVSSLS